MTAPTTLPLAELIARYDRPGPRYTSYPTAVEFHAGVTADVYETHLARADALADAPLSLYVHLPFCEERCGFCGCNVVITKHRDVADRYLDYLDREIDLLAAHLPRRRHGVAAALGRRHAHLLPGGAARARLRPPEPPLHADARGRGRPRDRSAGHLGRAAHAAAPARIQPAVDGGAGLHPRGAGGGQPRAELRADADARRARARGSASRR